MREKNGIRKEADHMSIHVTIVRNRLLAGFLCLLAGTSSIAAVASGEKVPPVSSAATNTAEKTEEEQKAAWQKRMQDARQQLMEAEARKAQLEQKRKKLETEWAGPDTQRTNEMIDAELRRTKGELLQAQQDIDKATNLIEVVIPDEARRAGVPPGWAR